MKRFYITILSFVCYLLIASSAEAATLSLDPASASVPVNGTFTVKIQINTEGESTTSTDAVMLFDDSILSVVSIVEGDNGSNPFYPDMFQSVNPGEIYVVGAVIDSIDSRSGTGTIATITFRGVSQGVSDVTFDCTPGRTSDTNISKNDKNQTDIVVCSSVTNGRYTVGSGPVTPVPVTPAVGTGPTLTPTPTMVVSGSTEVTIGIMALAVLFVIAGIGARFALS